MLRLTFETPNVDVSTCNCMSSKSSGSFVVYSGIFIESLIALTLYKLIGADHNACGIFMHTTPSSSALCIRSGTSMSVAFSSNADCTRSCDVCAMTMPTPV